MDFFFFFYRNIGDTANVQKIEKGYNINPISKKTVLCHGDNTMGKSCKTK